MPRKIVKPVRSISPERPLLSDPLLEKMRRVNAEIKRWYAEHPRDLADGGVPLRELFNSFALGTLTQDDLCLCLNTNIEIGIGFMSYGLDGKTPSYHDSQ